MLEQEFGGVPKPEIQPEKREIVLLLALLCHQRLTTLHRNTHRLEGAK